MIVGWSSPVLALMKSTASAFGSSLFSFGVVLNKLDLSKPVHLTWSVVLVAELMVSYNLFLPLSLPTLLSDQTGDNKEKTIPNPG
eukprot:4702232-Ditylum_brightwellii.AAC.1